MQKQRVRYTHLLRRYLAPQRARVGALAVLLLCSVALPLASPQIVRAFLDRALTRTVPLGSLVWLAVAYIVISIFIQIVSLGTTYLSEQVAWTATNWLRADLARHALGLDMPFHNRKTPGEMIERVDGDVTALSNFFSQFVMNIVWAVLLLTGVLVLTWREEWRIGLALTGFSVVWFLAIGRLRSYSIPHATRQREASANLFGFLEERLSGIEDIRANGAGMHVMRGYYRSARELYRASMRAERAWAGVLWTSTNMLFLAGNVMTLGMSAWLFLRGHLTIGTVYLLYQYTHMIREPLDIIGEQLRDFQKAGAGAGRVHELLEVQSEIDDGRGDAIPEGALSLRLQDVSFAYGSEPVLEHVDVDLAPGRVLGILGRTGSGKTTIARLVLRLWEPQSGRVLVGGTDVADASLTDLRARVGYVTQDVQLFGSTVRDNLTLFTDGADDPRIVEAIRTLGLGGWFDRLERGLDSHVSSGGSSLSAGEAQLLAFARVFLRDPGLVILDEASSRLDPATEHAIEHAVGRLLAGRTGVLIAHRLATVQRADDILILDDGRAVEHGPREALAADPASRFSQLLRTGLEEVLA